MRVRLNAAGRGIAILFFGLLLAAVLQAEGLRKQAQIQPAGFQRDLALDVTRPLVRVSRALHLTTPRHELQAAIGRENEDRIDSQVHLSLPPPAGPLPVEGASEAGSPKPAKAKSGTSRRGAPGISREHGDGYPSPKRHFTATKPLRIWVAGDSLAQIPGQALERLSNPAVRVVGVESRLSTGLARPDLYNWFTRVQDAPAQLEPNVAVFSFGADDAHDFMAGVPGGKHVGLLGSPSWNAEYRRRVDGVTRELDAKGIYVVWLGLPIPDGPGFKRSFPIVNRILESVVAAHPKAAAYVDTWHILDDAHGRFAPYLRVHGKLTLMRLPDGIHYTSAAGDLIAAQTLKQLSAVYRLG
ncbi:MAG: uncharacterized protein QOH95_1782 [Gaiellaceae bacterium]|nr:uncharacterized protein [Gaiellaceae bacterium]